MERNPSRHDRAGCHEVLLTAISLDYALKSCTLGQSIWSEKIRECLSTFHLPFGVNASAILGYTILDSEARSPVSSILVLTGLPRMGDERPVAQARGCGQGGCTWKN